MINWQRAMRTARNNGFDQIVGGGGVYHEKCKCQNVNWSRKLTARIMALTILPGCFLNSFSYHNCVEVIL